MMLRMAMVLCALSGCVSEDYPDARPFAVYDCGLCGVELDYDAADSRAEPSEDCANILGEMLGDDDHLLVPSAYQLLLWGDGWTFNMVMAQVDEVRYDSKIAASAEFRYGTILVHDLRRFRGLEGASALVHEAGHGRPADKGHVPCPDGELQCDTGLEGAVGTQLQFVQHALELARDPLVIDDLLRLEALTAERLLD